MTNAAHIIVLSSASAMLLAVGYILGRWHAAEIAEQAAVDAATGPGAGTNGSGGKPPVTR